MGLDSFGWADENPAMDELLTPTQIETMAKAAGVPMNELLRRAGVGVSVFQRWKNGANTPTLTTYRRIRDAAKALSADPPKPENVRDLIKFLGGPTIVAREIGSIATTVFSWGAKNKIGRGFHIPLWRMAVAKRIDWRPPEAEGLILADAPLASIEDQAAE